MFLKNQKGGLNLERLLPRNGAVAMPLTNMVAMKRLFLQKEFATSHLFLQSIVIKTRVPDGMEYVAQSCQQLLLSSIKVL